MFQSLDIPEQDMNNARNQRGNNYQIPSNLPSLFRLDSSSRTAPTLQSPISVRFSNILRDFIYFISTLYYVSLYSLIT